MEAQFPESLCSVCRNIDFQRLYNGKRVDDEVRMSLSTLLGTLAEITSRASLDSCICCTWISSNIEYYKERFEPPQDLETKKIKLCCDGSTVFDGREMNTHSTSGHLIAIVRLRVEPFRREDDTIADLRLVKALDPGTAIPEVLNGKLVDRKTTTVEQFKLWFNDCFSSHQHTEDRELSDHLSEEPPTDTLSEIPQFTLIDVSSRRLVTQSHLTRGGYMALSYVWGSAAPKMVPDAEGRLPPNLPATIEDALTLVSSLGFMTYLWVDSICIPQDDMSVRLAQIQKMDIIYSRAIATIIATGASVRAGLTGISINNNPSQSLQLGPYLLTYQPGRWKHLMTGFNDSASHFLPWGSRGWTFQEALISRRSLILNTAKDSIVFECTTNTRQTHPTDAFEQVRAGFFRDLARIEGESMNGWNIHWYQHLLNLYLQRSLSYEKDIVGAFTGVATMIARAVAKKKGEGLTCWTIPRRDFVAGLMWAPTRTCKQEVRREGVLDDGRHFPSWHWSSVVMKEGIAFVQGSEPLQLYEGCRAAWTKDWDEQTWEELERTGRMEFRAEVVDFNIGPQHPTIPTLDTAPQTPSAEISTQPQPLSLGKTDSLIDARQNATKAFRNRTGTFISCPAWAWAGTMQEVNEPLAVYPYSNRLGNPSRMNVNRVFALMVEWVGEDGKVRVCKRVGWAVVDLEEWRGSSVREERVLLV